MYLYSILLLSSITIPLVLSFEKNLRFYKRWKIILPSILLTASFFILCDIYLTHIGVWGFNPGYHSDIFLFNLPLEEWLFFILIPYACLFIHYSFIFHYPNAKLSVKHSNILSCILIAGLAVVVFFHHQKIYTLYIFSVVILGLILSLFDKNQTINSYYVTFLLILIPFFIVNAILTGSFIEQEVVWYNNEENLGIRIFTIPIEDIGYAFSLVLYNLLLIGKLKQLTDQ